MSVTFAASARLGAFTLDAAFETPGGVTGIFGPSGSGKSTILAAIAGLMRPDRGCIRVNGTAFLDTDRRIDLPPRARRCGLVFQDGRLFPHLSVRRNLFYGHRRSPRRDRVDPEAAIAAIGLGGLLERRPHALSGGERQRVALGRALLAAPDLLLMDEPLAALDGPRKAEILRHIETVRALHRVPILYVSHAFDEIVRLADHLVLVEGGRVIEAGPIEAVSRRPAAARLLGAEEASAVVAGRVAGHDETHALSRIALPGGDVFVPRLPRPPGETVRIRIRARDVALATGPLPGYTALNRLRGTIVALDATAPGRVTATIELAPGAALLAAVTALSVERLGLRPGLAVTAVVKSVTLGAATEGPWHGDGDGSGDGGA